jgi:hypothetical protein
MNEQIRITGAEETIYFGALPGKSILGQWLKVTIESGAARSVRAAATVTARGLSCTCPLEIEPGTREYRCYAPVLWPRHARDPAAILRIESPAGSPETSLPVGSHRPWNLYLLSDACSDYTWDYATEQRFLADDVALTEAELRALVATRSSQPWNRNRYNFAVGREVEYYERAHMPAEVAQLYGAIRDGDFTLNPIPCMTLSGSQSLEEMVRQLMPARARELAHGIAIRYANHQETPTMTWALASVLAGSGIPYLVKGLLPFGTPWAARLREPPIYRWEGPDGARVLVRRFNYHYNEGQFILRHPHAVRHAVERKVVPEYEALGDAYPFDAAGLVGVYSDLNADTAAQALRKAQNVAEYNGQGWEYPRIWNASHELFWKEIERQLAAGASVPVARGDYGTGWEVWTLTLAREHAQWRRLQERGPLADRLLALAARLPGGVSADMHRTYAEAWDRLIQLADHAWNGSDEANRRLNLELRRRWIAEAGQRFDDLIDHCLGMVAEDPRRASEGSAGTLVVFNGLGWRRGGIVALPDSISAGTVPLDPASGAPLDVQELGGRRWIAVNDTPSIGVLRFPLAPRPASAVRQHKPSDSVAAREGEIENRFYRVRLDPATGAIASIYSKTHGRELVRASDGAANRWAYRLDGVDGGATSASLEGAAGGPLFGEISAASSDGRLRVATTVRLYANFDRVDIENRVEKIARAERESLHFFFPFDVERGMFRFEAPGAVIAAGETSRGGEQLPGSGQAYTAVRHFADVSNHDFGVTLSQCDSGIVQFGDRTEAGDPVAPPEGSATLVAFVLDNTVNYPEVTRDQGGATAFTFRFSIRAHGPFDAADAVRFAWEDVKLAEESYGGSVAVRLWNTGMRAAVARINTDPRWTVKTACAADLLERRGAPLTLAANGVQVNVPARGFATVLIDFQG